MKVGTGNSNFIALQSKLIEKLLGKSQNFEMWKKISLKKGYIKTTWLKAAYFWAELKTARKT